MALTAPPTEWHNPTGVPTLAEFRIAEQNSVGKTAIVTNPIAAGVSSSLL